MFGTVLISVCTVMHIYVFWRTGTVPFVNRWLSKKALIGAAVILWVLFFLGRVAGHGGTGMLAAVLEFIGMTWMAGLFLTFIPLLVTDLITLFGFLLPKVSPSLRGYALIVGAILSGMALFQGLRPPAVVKYEVNLTDLPAEMDGTLLVGISDTHIGTQIGKGWLEERIKQVNALKPDIIVLLGDIFEGHGLPEAQIIEAFKQLSAPLGVWAVLGNHEFHHELAEHIEIYEAMGIRLLRNQWEELKPGLILAGVDDLTSARRGNYGSDFIPKALNGKPRGATILLSHTPWDSETAAKSGASLMLSGHTHGGQIWPFDYLVRLRYPLLEGRYEADGMTVIVCRGTGTWGPRMRLWHPAEILHITLRES
jgi:predicted MPP superfamily phosphohydrolase